MWKFVPLCRRGYGLSMRCCSCHARTASRPVTSARMNSSRIGRARIGATAEHDIVGEQAGEDVELTFVEAIHHRGQHSRASAIDAGGLVAGHGHAIVPLSPVPALVFAGVADAQENGVTGA